MGNKEGRCSITIQLPVEKRDALNKLALETGMTAASIIRNLIYVRLADSGKE